MQMSTAIADYWWSHRHNLMHHLSFVRRLQSTKNWTLGTHESPMAAHVIDKTQSAFHCLRNLCSVQAYCCLSNVKENEVF